MVLPSISHWLVLETALLPTFSIVERGLTSEDAKEKLAASVISSCLEG